MLIDDLNYELPEKLIAQCPTDKRENSRLMVIRRKSHTIEECFFHEIGQYLRPGDLLVINNTKVLAARLFAKRQTGGKIEILLLSPEDERTWEAMVKPAKRVRVGETLTFRSGGQVEVVGQLTRGRRLLQFHRAESANEIMAAEGQLPLPPYVKDPQAVEQSRYQTVYAKKPGAVAAPTAGLHFTKELMAQLKAKGVDFVEVTLYVGAGTFLPLKSSVIEENELHRERFEITEEACRTIGAALAEGRRVIPVGTTSMRVIETLGPQGFKGSQSGETSIFIYPGVEIKVASAMITNFHLPGTSLLCLVAAFAGVSLYKEAYARAVKEQFRFYSFGDAMLIMD